MFNLIKRIFIADAPKRATINRVRNSASDGRFARKIKVTGMCQKETYFYVASNGGKYVN